MVKKLVLITLFTIVYTSQIFGLNFQVSELISIPGNNRNFDILEEGEFGSTNYICWENQIGSVYTIYLKQIDNDSSEHIVVYSDIAPNINPQLAINRFSQGIKIIWQSKVNNHWQLLQRNYNNDSLGQVISVTDSLSDNIDPSLSIHRVAYINNGRLMIKAFYPECEGYSVPIVIDSVNCSNPNIYYGDIYDYTAITYEKGGEGHKEIYNAKYSYNYLSREYSWKVERISEEGEDNLNPRFTTYPEAIIYQSYIDGFWRIITFCFGYSSNNTDCNFFNPDIFLYDIPIGGNHTYTPYFCVFDTDSVNNNQEIFIETFYNYPDTIMNISNSSGYDCKPIVTIVSDSVTIIWEHIENSKTDIWWAKDKFNSYPGGAINDQDSKEPAIFILNQNYPNPFNPSTIISFQIRESISKKAVIKIYNSIGELVRTIPENINEAGYYSVSWDGKSDDGNILPTGNYIYSINYGNISKTGKMTLVK